MKTTNLIKIAPMILLGIALCGTVRANGDKFSRADRHSLGQISRSIQLTGEDVRNLIMLFAETEKVSVSMNNDELKLAFQAGDNPDYTILFKIINSEPVEDWMFESDYLSEEQTGEIESWMVDHEYLDGQIQPLESWMFSETLLSGPETEAGVESWMLDANYLSK